MNKKQKMVSLAGLGLVFGTAFGAIFGNMFGNVGLGIALGAALGLLFAPAVKETSVEEKL
jgi:uncharacterized membrane protein